MKLLAMFFHLPKLKRPVTATQVLRWEDLLAGWFVMLLQKMVFLPLDMERTDRSISSADFVASMKKPKSLLKSTVS